MSSKRPRSFDRPGFAKQLQHRRRAQQARLRREQIQKGLRRNPFERLEARQLLATLNWDGGGDGQRWSDPQNWDTDRVPTLGDVAIIEDTDGSLLVRIDQDVQVDEIQSTEHLRVEGARLQVERLDVDRLEFFDGELGAPLGSTYDATVQTRLNYASEGNQFVVLGNLHVAGDLELSFGADLLAFGDVASLTVDGNVELSGSDVDVEAGARVRFTNWDRLEHQSQFSGDDARFLVSGANSRLEFPALTSIIGGDHSAADLSFQVSDGGSLDLSSVTRITDPAGSATHRSISLEASDPDSVIDLSSLVSFVDLDTHERSALVSFGGGEIRLDALDTLSGASVWINDAAVPDLQNLSWVDDTLIILGDSIDTPALTRLTRSSVTVNQGAQWTAASLNQMDGTTLIAEDGGTIDLPAVTRYVAIDPSNYNIDRFRASGAGSRVTLANLESIQNGDRFNQDFYLTAESGGRVELPALRALYEPESGDHYGKQLRVTADGAGSVVDLPLLESIQGAEYGNQDLHLSIVRATDGGDIAAPLLRNLSGVWLSMADSGSLLASQFETILGGRLSVSGTDQIFANLISAAGSRIEAIDAGFFAPQLVDASRGELAIRSDIPFSVPALSRIDGSNLIVQNGGTLAIPAVHRYRDEDWAYHTFVWSVDGADSRLEMPNLRTIAGSAGYRSNHDFVISNGAVMDLSAVESIAGDVGNDGQSRMRFMAAGTDSVLDLSSVVTVSDPVTDFRSLIQATTGAQVHTDVVQSSMGFEWRDDSSGQMSFDTLENLLDSKLTLTNKTITLSNLQRATGSDLELSDADLTLPNIDSLRLGHIHVTGTANLNAPALTDIDGSGLYVGGGANLDLPNVTHFDFAGLGAWNDLQWQVNGAGSELSLPDLVSITNGIQYENDLTIRADDGGTLMLPSLERLVDRAGGDVTRRSIYVIASGTDSRIEMPTLTSFVDEYSTGASNQWSIIDAEDGGVIDAPQLRQLHGVWTRLDTAGDIAIANLNDIDDADVIIDAVDSNAASNLDARRSRFTLTDTAADWSNLQVFRHNHLTIGLDASVDLSAATNIDGSGFTIQDGANLSLPQVQHYSLDSLASWQTVNWSVVGDSSTLDLSGLQWIRGGTEYQATLNITASDGGDIDLSGVRQIVDPVQGDQTRRQIHVRSSGDDSRIDLGQLENFIDRRSTRRSSTGITDNGILIAPQLESFQHVDLVNWPPVGSRGTGGSGDGGSGDGGSGDGSKGDRSTGDASRGKGSGDGGVSKSNDDGGSTGQTGGFVSWVGGDGDWNTGANWSTGSLPRAGDQVLIPGADVTVSISSGNPSVGSLTGAGTLQLTGGSLTTTGISQWSGELRLSPGTTLAASGPDAVFEATGTQTIDGAGFVVTSGGTIRLSEASDYSHAATGNSQQRRWTVVGEGSRLIFDNLQTLVGGDRYGSRLVMDVDAGGRIEMPELLSIHAAEGTQRRRGIDLSVTGQDSVIAMPLLTAVTAAADYDDGYASAWHASLGGQIQTPALVSLRGVDVTADRSQAVDLEAVQTLDQVMLAMHGFSLILPALATASDVDFQMTGADFEAANLTSATGGGIRLTGGSFIAPQLANIDGANLQVTSGSTLRLPLVTSYAFAGPGSYQDRTWMIDGFGSRLELPALESLVGGSFFQNRMRITVASGGVLSLPALTRINESTGDTGRRSIRFHATGPGSEIQLDSLTDFDDLNSEERSSLEASWFGRVHSPVLDTVGAVLVKSDGMGTVDTSSLTTINGGGFELSGGDFSATSLTSVSGALLRLRSATIDLGGLDNWTGGSIEAFSGTTFSNPNLTSIDGTSLRAETGGSIDLPSVTAYDFASPANYLSRQWTARGVDASIRLENLQSVIGPERYENLWSWNVSGGATLSTPALETITTGGGDRARVDVNLSGGESVLDWSSLNSWTDDRSNNADGRQVSKFSLRDNAVPLLGALETLRGVEISIVDSQADLSTLTTLDTGRLRVSGASVSLPLLETIENTFLSATGGTLTLPALTTLTRGGIEWESGGIVHVPVLANIDGSSLWVSDGNEVNLPGVTAYDFLSLANYESRIWQVRNAGSRLGLPNLESVLGGTRFSNVLTVEAIGGAVLDLPALLSIEDPDAGDDGRRRIAYLSDGEGSEIRMPSLTTFIDRGESAVRSGATSYHSSIVSQRGGRVNLSSLADISGVRMTIDNLVDVPATTLTTATNSIFEFSGPQALSMPAITSADGSDWRINGVAFQAPNLTRLVGGGIRLSGGATWVSDSLNNFDSAHIHLLGGITLSLPGLTRLHHDANANYQSMSVVVEGEGTVLDLPNVTSIENGLYFRNVSTFSVYSGGQIRLPELVSIRDVDAGNQSYRRFHFLAEGINSRIDVPRLAEFSDAWSGSLTAANTSSTLDARWGGTLLLGSSETIAQWTGVVATMDSTTTLEGQSHVAGDSTLTSGGRIDGDLEVSGIVDADGSLQIDGDLILEEGGQLTIDIGGLIPIAQHDVFEISGDARLDGTIALRKQNNHNPVEGDSYQVMHYGSRSGSPTYSGLDFGSQLLTPELSPTFLEFITGFSSGAGVTEINASVAGIDADGPFVLVTFNEAIDGDTFTPEDVVLTGPNGEVEIESIDFHFESNNIFQLRPDLSQYVDGAYTIALGPDVFDFVGNPMNQDGDENNGEADDDVFTGSFDWSLPDLVVT
ncbi:MAG: hypothetical protein AAF958_13615, partial [Planctomycetota bacterium]